ncbi:PAS domain S-box-containing protein [Bradyrhizobium erythrophlei]|jgi:PAS domain S-box-containing protein|nr:PAS domain S-box-containing protein [Bradyrhizobium erythrophlei]
MPSPLRILLLEDDPGDAEVIQDLLEADHFVCDVTRVETRDELLDALRSVGFDLILADYTLPSFDGITALKLAHSMCPDLPFIFVAGTLGEEAAIDSLKMGATDYVLKTRLSKLAPSVERALCEAQERTERKKAETALRFSEMYLAEAQRLSHTGSFGWDSSTGEIYWSDETYRIFEYDPTTKPTLQMVVDRSHPDDRMRVSQIIDRVSIERSDFSVEHRLMMPNGSVKFLQVVAHRAVGEDSKALLFLGAVTDITERKRAEEEHGRLRQLEADLARINRLSVMGELAASLTHEILQPIAGVTMSARACSNWLQREPPEIEQTRRGISDIMKNANRAAHIIDRNHSLYSRRTPQRELIDLNEIIREMITLLQDAANRELVSIRGELDPALPRTMADRVQLQQVLMNLMLNGIEAMKEKSGELRVSSKRTEDGRLLISVTDSGAGLPRNEAERIFEAFFTTKPQGTGMGLSISRRIIESHGGSLWASANTGPGSTFQFVLPTR